MDNSIILPPSQGGRPLCILHVDTERGWRGGERQLLWLAQGLAALGDRCIVAARRGEPLAQRANDAGFEVIELAPAFEADPRAALTVWRALHRHGIDVVHAHASHAVTVGALGTLGTSVPLIASRRVDFPLRSNAGTRWKYGRASTVVAISQAVADVVARAGLATPVVVIPDGTDVSRVPAPASRQQLAELGVPAQAPLVVQVAQLVGHKDPLTFVHAVAAARRRIPDLHALLVGDGPLRAAVERAVIETGLTGCLHLLGYRNDADNLLAAATVVTLSSREEGMGSVLLDAMVFGKPVAATLAGGIPEVVREGQTGLLVAVGDATALGDAIATLVSDTATATRFARAARMQAKAFSLDIMATRTRAVYSHAIAAC